MQMPGPTKNPGACEDRNDKRKGLPLSMSTKAVYTDASQTAIISLQRQGGRLVRMRPDGKRPAFKWGGRTGRCLTQHQAESWLRARRALCTGSLLHWIQCLGYRRRPLARTSPLSTHPMPSYPQSRLWRRHLYYSDSSPRPNAQKRQALRLSSGCTFSVGLRRSVAP